jgi:hypothetical protein
MMAIHTSPSHQPPCLRISHISIFFQRNRNAVRIDRKITSLRLYTPGTSVTRHHIDHTTNETLSCHLIGFTRCIIDTVERVASELTLGRTSTQNGQGARGRLPSQAGEITMCDRGNLEPASESIVKHAGFETHVEVAGEQHIQNLRVEFLSNTHFHSCMATTRPARTLARRLPTTMTTASQSQRHCEEEMRSK